MQLTGLHHVTAITANAAQNLTFYTRDLGMRLVKKTVNQDDVSAYHLFYADALGSPGTDVTFFDWPHVVKNTTGAGSVSAVGLRVPSRAALDWWAQRLAPFGASGVVEEGGRDLVRFTDPEGLPLELISDEGARVPGGEPWERSPVPAAQGITGLYSVKMLARSLKPTATVLEEVLGFRAVREYHAENDSSRPVMVFETGAGGPGAEVHVEYGAHLGPGRQGRGGVHHVAFRTPGDAEHMAWQQRIASSGLSVTPVIDRFYFKSIYFREPGGVLFEIATDGPGFAADEDPRHLGEQLALPPFLEPRRAQIEAHLHPLA